MNESSNKHLVSEALAAMNAGDAAKAESILHLLVEKGGDVWDALGHRAWMFKCHGRFAEALADYRRMLSMPEANAEVRILAGECLVSLGQFENAAREGAQVLLADPANAQAWSLMARAREKMFPVPNPLSPVTPGHKASASAINPVIAALQSDKSTYPSSVYPEVGHLIYSIVRALRPRVAIETGSYIGYSATCTAQAMEDNGFGELHSFDLFLELADYTSPILGRMSDRLKAAQGHVEAAGLSHRVTFYKGDSSSNINDQLVAKNTRIDFAFIDGDHSIQGALKDWKVVDQCMNEGGIIMLHDTVPERCHWLGPAFLLEAMKHEPMKQYGFVNLPTLHGLGVALIQKKTSAPSPEWKPTLLDTIIDRLFINNYWSAKRMARFK